MPEVNACMLEAKIVVLLVGLQPGCILERCEFKSGSDLEQVQSSDDQTKAPETKLGQEVDQALRQRAVSILLAGGCMVLITDEPAVAKVLQNSSSCYLHSFLSRRLMHPWMRRGPGEHSRKRCWLWCWPARSNLAR